MAKIIDPRIWASTELVEKRKKICDECEHKKYILHNSLQLEQCGECKCLLKPKRAVVQIERPLGKW